LDVLLFDLDETLYSRRLGVIPRIDRRINDYLRDRMGIAEVDVDSLRQRFWREHGTTLRGLMAAYEVDPTDYLAFIHEVDLSDVLRADEELGTLLRRLPGRKVIFTNASRLHGSRVLDLLGIGTAFERVFGLDDRAYVPKPEPAAYRAVLEALGVEPASCCLIDDAPQNLPPAKALGMRTIWICESGEQDGDADHVISTLAELESLLASP
jgi:putative hydrolase of the HAD superfamily